MFRVSQGSILGSLLFNIFSCNLFLIIEHIDLASYTGDNTPYITGNSIEEVIQKTLQNRSFTGLVITKWKLTLINVTFSVAQTVKLV